MTPDEIVTLATDRGVQLVRFLYCDNGGVIRGKSTHVGLVRDLARQITPELEAVLLQVQRRSRNMSGLNPSFRTSVEDTIDLLFKD